ncbi:hypothetical protein F0562_026260 [Nyssa sinensis]|uniref:Uncharacterized protein n=1 Tax=Nyssa sinensis TaxID=561372 RepID=A0A5J5BAA3_9ASTE|nr:hypothetical protein F0562_026260 [Nyssa sinensis]
MLGLNFFRSENGSGGKFASDRFIRNRFIQPFFLKSSCSQSQRSTVAAIDKREDALRLKFRMSPSTQNHRCGQKTNHCSSRERHAFAHNQVVDKEYKNKHVG